MFLSLDTYMSHEGVIYCKAHHRELFQPKVVHEDIADMGKKKKNRPAGDMSSFTEEAIGKYAVQSYNVYSKR